MMDESSSTLTNLSFEQCLINLKQELHQLHLLRQELNSQILRLNNFDFKIIVSEVIKEIQNGGHIEVESFDDLLLINAKMVLRNHVNQL